MLQYKIIQPNLLKVIYQIYGVDITKKMVSIDGENDDYYVSGFISYPEVTKSNYNTIPKAQYFYLKESQGSLQTYNDIDIIIENVQKGNHYMIEEVIVNHPDVAKVNPDSVNTLRVETCLDSKGDFHLLNVLFMVGSTKTIVSNCHSGGMMCHVDMKTGCIDNAGYNPKGIWYEVHPASGIKLRGYKLPYIDKLEEYIKGVCQVMPNARYVGWDVVITPDGFELIEGNFCPGQCTQVCDGIPKYEMLKSYI